MKLCGIYKITNKTNNKVYIGQSIDIEGRWKEHIWYLKNNKHYNSYLQNSYNKYGYDKFNFSIINLCNISQLSILENEYILSYNSINKNNGYNIIFANNIQNNLSNRRSSKYDKYIQIILDCYRECLSFNEVAKRLNISHHTVARLIRKEEYKINQQIELPGVVLNSRKYKQLIPMWINLYKQGRSSYDIAEMYNVNPSVVINNLRIYKIDIKKSNSDCYLISRRKYQHFLSEWKSLHNRGHSYYYIGKLYNVDRTVVMDYIKKY